MGPKLILKKAIGRMVHAYGAMAPAQGKEKGLRVLCYHSITDDAAGSESYHMTTPRRLFEEQMEFLHKNGYNILPLDKAVEVLCGHSPMPEKAVSITFDDGFKDNLTNALPVLARYAFRAAIFVTVGLAGTSRDYLDWDGIRQLAQSGIFTIGSHAYNHVKLKGLSRDAAEVEASLSKKFIEDKIAGAVDLFAYPFGSYDSFDRQAEDALRKCGYKAAFTTVAGLNFTSSNPYNIRRTRISWYDDKREFAKELAGSYDWYRIWQKVTTAL